MEVSTFITYTFPLAYVYPDQTSNYVNTRGIARFNKRGIPPQGEWDNNLGHHISVVNYS